MPFEVLVLESAGFELPKIGATACLMVRLLSLARYRDVGAVRSCSISTESESALSSGVRKPLNGFYLEHAEHFRASQIPVRVNVSGKQRFVISNRRSMRKHQP